MGHLFAGGGKNCLFPRKTQNLTHLKGLWRMIKSRFDVLPGFTCPILVACLLRRKLAQSKA
jgi:hypothetical protein